MSFVIYVVDTETTGFDPEVNDVIELSIYRMSDDAQKTWCLKPKNQNAIEAGALRVNGHVLQDLKHETKFGRETYLDPAKVLVEVENWMMEDGVTSEDRILLGQNPNFDKNFMEKLWKKCDSSGTFPFGRKLIDTIQMELIMTMLGISDAAKFSLSALSKKYGIKNEKAHSAWADTKATKLLFEEQLKLLKSKLIG